MAELETEGEQPRREVAAFLREFAHELDGGPIHSDEYHGGSVTEVPQEDSLEPKRITLIVGGDSATITVPSTVEFGVEIESRSPMLSSKVNQEIEFELSWEVANPDEHDEEGIEIG